MMAIDLTSIRLLASLQQTRKKTMNNCPRVSPSQLGALASPEACRRCYYLLLRSNFKKVHGFPMPGVMHGLDKCEKQVAAATLSILNGLPEFYGPFRSATRVLPIKRVSAHHKETGVNVYGNPDLVLSSNDGTVMVLDNKTASPKDETHPLFLNYRAQLNIYGYALEYGTDALSVSRLGLLHYEYEPVEDEDAVELISDEGIRVPFKATVIEVPYDPKTILTPLLTEYRELLEMESPPASTSDCADCDLLNEWREWLRQEDALEVQPWMSPQERKEIQARLRYRAVSPTRSWRRNLLGLANPDGVLANWLLGNKDDDDSE